MPRPRSSAVAMVAAFLALATLILIATSLALTFPGSLFERLWEVYPARRDQLMPYRLLAVPGFLLLAGFCATATAGTRLRQRWGWQLAVLIFALNALGNLIRLLSGHTAEGGFAVAVSVMILFFLTRAEVMQNFFEAD